MSEPNAEQSPKTRRIAVELAPQTIEQIAARVAALLRSEQPDTNGGLPRLITAGELAHQLRVQRPWVYRHRSLLGGRRIGAGPRAPWRFELDTATKALELRRNAQNPGGDR